MLFSFDQAENKIIVVIYNRLMGDFVEDLTWQPEVFTHFLSSKIIPREIKKYIDCLILT